MQLPQSSRWRHTLSRTVLLTFALPTVYSPVVRAQLGQSPAGRVMPVELRVSGVEVPVGLADQTPFFGWQLQSESAGSYDIAQSAYRLLVASSPALLDRERGDFWDSGRVESRTYIHVTYAGLPLKSHTVYFWKVCVWVSAGNRSNCSAVSHWTTALLHPEDWIAKWIAAEPDGPLEPQTREGVDEIHTKPEAMPLFRRSFQLPKPVKRAIVYVSGLGQYELHLNGRPITDWVMTPGWTGYRKEVLYDTYDLTAALKPGENTFGVMLGNGMYRVPALDGRYAKFTGSFGNPKMILQMQVSFVDGTEQTIVSDRSWQTAPGPIVLSSIFGGEDYDARREETGWDTAADSSWSHALEVAAPGGSTDAGKSLKAMPVPPMKVMETVKPSRRPELRQDTQIDTQIYDLGKNISGWPEIQVKGHAGDIVRMLPGELLDGDGEVTQRSAAAGKDDPVLFTYTLRGDGIEIWHPRFSYYGFRYVQVQTVRAHPGAAPPEILSLAGDFVHDAVTVDGSFQSGAPLLNDIHRLIDRAILSNLASVLTDCPTREKLGWLEQTYLNAGSLFYNYDVSQLYSKIAEDISEAQLADGLVPSIAPEFVAFVHGDGTSTPFRDSPEWGSAVILSAWAAYQFYGDTGVLAKHYESMARYANYLKSKSVDNMLSFGLGDWYDVGPGAPGESQLTGKGLTATAIYYQDFVTLARIATALGKAGDADLYAQDASEVKAAFNRALYHADTKSYDRGSQTANAMPLYLGLVPDEDRAAVLANLIADIRAHGNHVTAGDVGFHYVVGALSHFGRSDVLYDMATRTDSPSYGYQLSHGATTLTEAWDANPNSSQNHFMLGHAEEWLYRGLAGIDFDLSRGGADRIQLAPALDSGASDASATVKTVLGTIGSSWRRNGHDWTADFVIPPGAQATLILPAGAASSEVHGHAIDEPDTGVSGKTMPTERWVLGSGTYRFAGRL